MDQDKGIVPLDSVARIIADGLSEAALRLDHADCYEDFVAAVEAHRRVWQGLCEAAPGLGVDIPERIRSFSLAMPKKVDHGLSDYEIEALICFDRYVSAAITEAFPN
ncbi:MAG: hypothetical protein ACM33T_12210 [Solirubrobacterales bacterium]